MEIYTVTLTIKREPHQRHPKTWLWHDLVPGVTRVTVKAQRIRNRRTASARGRVRGCAR